MALSSWSAFSITGEFAANDLVAHGSNVLILLAAAMIVYRSFRERYLLAWILGWIAYLAHKLLLSYHWSIPSKVALAGAHVFFVGALLLFAASILIYTGRRRLLPLFSSIALGAGLVAVLSVLLWPQVRPLTWLVYGLYAVITAGAAIQLALFNRGRRHLGPWLLALTLILLHVDARPAMAHAIPDLVLELLLGLSMLITALDESKLRARRLDAMNMITTSIAQAQHFSSILHTTLSELMTLMEGSSAWFRLLEGRELVLVSHVNLPEDYAHQRHTIALEGSFSERVIREGAPRMVRVSATDPLTRERLYNNGYDHVVLVPVHGKSSVIGTLTIGSPRFRSYTPDEMDFLKTTSRQIGLAVENLRLVDQILRSQKQWVSTFDSIEDVIFVHDGENRLMKANRSMLRRLRRGHTEIIEQRCEDVLPGGGVEWQGCPYCNLKPSLSGQSDPCFGGVSLVSTSSYTEGETSRGTIHIVKDITRQRAIEERYKMFFEQVHEGVFISTPDGKLLDCNDAFAHMLGYNNKHEVLPVDISSTLYAVPSERETFLREMSTRGMVRNYEVHLRRKDGSTVIALETSFASKDPSGKIERYQGFLLDITEKKHAEEEIRRRNRELYSLNTIANAATQSFDLDEILNVTLRQVVELFSADTGAVYLMDQESGLLKRRAGFGHRSDVALRMPDVKLPDEFWDTVQRSRTQVVTHQHIARLPKLVVDFVSAESLQSWMWVILWSQNKVVGVLGVSSRMPRDYSSSDENLLIAIGRQMATTIEKIRLYEETSRAYEDLRRTQEQLLQSEKMSAIGQLISGVAHELNNPLTAILGYAQLLENEGLAEKSRDFVDKLYKQAQRTHRIVQNLLSFARQRKPTKTEVDINKVLEDTLALRDYDLKLNNIELVRDIDPELPTSIADAHQLEQVFLNILNNAVDAMLEHARSGCVIVRTFARDGFVCAEFQDSGPGIKEPKRVFDPFYTTKGPGKGTGLGLSICYGIIKEHGGEIFARNAEDGGAVFQVRLPMAVKPVHRSELHPGSERSDAVLRGRVLLVDDEESVLDFESEVLTGTGLEVIALSRGDEAIARLQNDSFDVIIVDSKMPGGWTGIDIYNWVREHRPNLVRCMVLTLSNVTEPDTRQFIEKSGILCIVKPFEIADLIGVTRRILTRTRAVVSSR